ncbi:unnamed protein product [Rotaria sp. Silwood2]|nr:unnamed protein product [Rotaria sp. Silwood2]CAF3903715.1 unnamed protein product [Rotaria sp. Silwood2]
MSYAKQSKTDKKDQDFFMDFKSKTLSNLNKNDSTIENSIIIEKFRIVALAQNATTRLEKSIRNKQSRKPPVPSRYVSIKVNNDKTKLKPLTNKNDTLSLIVENNEEDIILPVIDNIIATKQQPDLEKLNSQKNLFNQIKSLNDDTIISNQGAITDITNTPNLLIFRSNRFKTKKIEIETEENDENSITNQETLDLLVKIKDSTSAISIGPMPLSLQACRFELPYDLKLLEKMTPLDYLTNYCRLSSRRQYQFKRLFSRYRNKHYLFESSDLYLSIASIHKENFKRIHFNHLCQLIDLDNQEREFKFETYAGILALCERIIFYSSKLYNDYDDIYLTKHAIERCDFDGLSRKLDGLAIRDTMKRLLQAL